MTLLLVGLALVMLGGLAAWTLDGKPRPAERLFAWCVGSGCSLGLAAALGALVGGPAGSAPGPLGALGPFGPDAPFGIDRLSAWFVAIVCGVGGIAALYGVPYLRRERGRRHVGGAHLLVALLIVGLVGVVTAREVIAFMASWEVMAITAYFLVVFEKDRPEALRAGMVYVILTHVCTLALMGMFALWASGGALWKFPWRFDDLARAATSGAVPRGPLLALGLIGFGVKAGAVPFHFWLPGAHAASPSHASAILSGVMLKVGVYGLLRLLTMTGPAPSWWGWILLFAGVASSVLGVLWALAQHDVKRLLAYHSVENIGIIFIGLGLGSLGATYNQPILALLGFGGALLHTTNHALFKSLLFLGAGAAARAAGTYDLDRMGGLVRRIPGTAFAFLIGSIAIVGLPPLNGFVSEWVIFNGLFRASTVPGTLGAAALAVAALALTGGLALACFTKLFGVVFLGTPRDVVPHHDRTEARSLERPQLVLAAGCVAIGFLPVAFVAGAVQTAQTVCPAATAGVAVSFATEPAIAVSTAAAALLLTAGLLALARATTLRVSRRAAGPTWGCAYAKPTARAQHTASSYAAPLLAAFGPASGSKAERGSERFRTRPIDLALDALVLPAWKRVERAARRLRRIQAGGLRSYLLYVIACLLGLLVYLRWKAPL